MSEIADAGPKPRFAPLATAVNEVAIAIPFCTGLLDRASSLRSAAPGVFVIIIVMPTGSSLYAAGEGIARPRDGPEDAEALDPPCINVLALGEALKEPCDCFMRFPTGKPPRCFFAGICGSDTALLVVSVLYGPPASAPPSLVSCKSPVLLPTCNPNACCPCICTVWNCSFCSMPPYDRRAWDALICFSRVTAFAAVDNLKPFRLCGGSMPAPVPSGSSSSPALGRLKPWSPSRPCG
mmetsp:Transcript_143449/g.458612  ORF Transcript_143449/g.458612 Transcript_143449/m.458612 type:complete len:237 (-) Transcript_143449:4159-4869(-)